MRPPTFLYRYRPLNSEAQVERELASINEAYLWFSRFVDLNDPTEMTDANVLPVKTSTSFWLEVLLGNHGAEIAKTMNNKARFFSTSLMPKDTSSICCFSESNCNRVMWAHYGSSYRGMCVCYDVEKLLALSNFCWGNGFHPVRYLETKNIDSEKTLGDHDGTNASYGSFTIKHSAWAYEKEWRLLWREGTGKNFHTRNAIVEIVIGPNTPPEIAKRIERAAENSLFDIAYAYFEGFELKVQRKGGTHNPQTCLCAISPNVAEKQKELVIQGYDAGSLELAIQKARLYPDASMLHYIGVFDDEPYLWAMLGVRLFDGTEGVKTLKFLIKGKGFSPIYQ